MWFSFTNILFVYCITNARFTQNAKNASMDIRQKPVFFSSHYLTKLQDSMNHASGHKCEEEKYLPEENK